MKKGANRSDCCGALVNTSYVQYVDDAFYSCARCGKPCATVTVGLDNELSDIDFDNDVAERNAEFDAMYSKKEEK